MSNVERASITVAVVGGGPAGLEAAAAAAHLGFDVKLFERSSGVGASPTLWGHVRLFTPWRLNRSTLGTRMVRESCSAAAEPDMEYCPTGAEYVAQYLLPLSTHPLLQGRIETGARVVSISRDNTLKGDLLAGGGAGRRSRLFRLLIERDDGSERIVHAHVVIDASGTYLTPRWIGSGGMPAPGERTASIIRHIPDILGRDRAEYVGKKVLLVGAGMSAATTVCALAKLAAEEAAAGESSSTLNVVWAVRAANRMPPFAPIPGDSLPARVRLISDANALALAGSQPEAAGDARCCVQLRAGVSIEQIRGDSSSSSSSSSSNVCGGGGGFLVRWHGAAEDEHFDRVISMAGYRPDRSLWEEVQVHECYASGGPMKLAAYLLQSAGGDCLAQTSGGAELMRNPEPDFFIIGHKSYGRANNFLLRLGHEQVRDVMSLLTSDATLELA